MYSSDFVAIGSKWKRIICLFRGHHWCLYSCTEFTGNTKRPFYGFPTSRLETYMRDVCSRCGKIRR